MRKSKGSILNSISGLLIILAAAILMITFLYIEELAEYKEKIKQLARGYMLEMESVGYLTPESKASLLQNLTDNQLTNIDLTGTTITRTGYGQDIMLSIKGTLPLEELNTSSGDILRFFFARSDWDIFVYLQSTAKY